MKIDYTAEQRALQPLLNAANINSASFLATDYLNHYNEIIMLLEMVPDMPDLVEDTYDWAPKSYAQHFIDSGFKDTDLAVEAFEIAPNAFKAPFQDIQAELDTVISATVQGLKAVNVLDRGLSEQAAQLIRNRVEQTQGLLAKLNQIIHGLSKIHTTDAGEVTSQEPENASDTKSQADIDALFD